MNFTQTLIKWYGQNRRDLPWRNTTDAYLIWISEIILQQTRVVQGMDYFFRFTERFPDIHTLAVADEDEVLKYWEGLGYYSRARNLHAAAQDVEARFGGAFPSDYADVLSLKGIGEYTAAAICSFAWRLPYAVLDGNVYRVLSRFFAVNVPIDGSMGKKMFTELADKLLDRSHPDIYNQAIMDFGAIQCTPQSPNCEACPLMDACAAFAAGKVADFPVKMQRTKVRARYFNYLHVTVNGETLLRRRAGRDIWRGLYEFPMIETDAPIDYAGLQSLDEFRRLFEGQTSVWLQKSIEMSMHQLSHQSLYAKFYRIEITCDTPQLADYLHVLSDEIEKYAYPRLITLYLEKA